MVNTNISESNSPDSFTFSNKDMEGVNFPYNDAIAIKTNIGGAKVRCLLIDNGRSNDILFLDAFMKIEIKPSSMKVESMLDSQVIKFLLLR